MVTHNYYKLISVENLFQAWSEFKKGKGKRKDVQFFERNLEDNLFSLHQSLVKKTYKHGSYESFFVNDPKRRHIHKASVIDRVVHHLLYKHLYGVFDKTFIFDSYSCRLEKGTHRGVKRLEKFTRIVSKNYTRECWALKLDIKKFFASVDQEVLLHLLSERVKDKDVLGLLKAVIGSFHSGEVEGKGIPLGNLTSQVFANIYMNELDQFVKQDLRIKYYLRYADDFIIMSPSSNDLNHWIKPIKQFLERNLKLELHSKKIIFRKLDWGIDFLGYIILPHYILPRTKTKNRVFKKLKIIYSSCSNDSYQLNQSLQSYLGYLSYANTYKLSTLLINLFGH